MKELPWHMLPAYLPKMEKESGSPFTQIDGFRSLWARTKMQRCLAVSGPQKFWDAYSMRRVWAMLMFFDQRASLRLT
eukprot:9992823-Karenia_brevis.AAC.1